jgi:hypothetical protein
MSETCTATFRGRLVASLWLWDPGNDVSATEPSVTGWPIRGGLESAADAHVGTPSES